MTPIIRLEIETASSALTTFLERKIDKFRILSCVKDENINGKNMSFIDALINVKKKC